MSERARDGDALALADRQLRRQPRTERAEAERFEQRHRPRRIRLAQQALYQHDVLERRQARQQTAGLQHHADMARTQAGAGIDGTALPEPRDIVAEQFAAPDARRLPQQRQQVDQRALAAARWTDHANHLARLQPQ